MKTRILLCIALMHSLNSFSNYYSGERNDQYFTSTTNDSIINKPKFSLFVEAGGKGYYSFNTDFVIKNNHRLSIVITELDYNYFDESLGHGTDVSHLSPGIMYYYLKGNGPSYFEIGAGISTSPRLNVDYVYKEVGEEELHTNSPISLHGVIGYRYQKQNGLFFRAGFTPFYRINDWFLPLLGISLGYSW